MMKVILHYVVEGLSVAAITLIAVAYMVAGGFETPVILSAFVAIGGIAAWDIHKREQNKE
ncbi:hypothetical protein ES704_01808 [subsurface metagenome]|jgi:hypothetical protein